jgi:hypothetical protein
MSDYICSVDPGNGFTNGVMAKSKGGYKSVTFPSVRAAATGDSLGLGADLELDYEFVDWNGHRYVIGDDVIRVTRRSLERHMGTNRYGNEFHQFLVAVALAKLGIQQGTVNLTLFAPPGMYLDAKTMIQERFGEYDGEATIKLKGDKKPRTWHYDSITVWPEGIGAAACFVLDDNGQSVETDVMAGDVVILDIGAFTLDALKLVDGSFNPEALEHATWDNGGVNVHIREPILRMLKKQRDDFGGLTVDDVDQVIRRGLSSGDYTLKVAGHVVDLESVVDKYIERYAGWIANNIADGVFEGFRGIKSVILVGGGAVLIEDFMQEWFPDKILNRSKHPTTKKIHPVDFNAVGGMRFALMNGQ